MALRYTPDQNGLCRQCYTSARAHLPEGECPRWAFEWENEMPTYLGKPVSDDFMQGLIEGYRDGQRLAGAAVEDGDAPIITRLTEEKVLTERGAVVLGFTDAQGKGVEE